MQVQLEWLRKNSKQLLFYITFFMFILTFSTLAKNYDYDFWARLIVGKHIFQTGAVLKQDFLSYTPTHLWIDHEWGSSAIFYFVLKYFSAAGILLLQSILIFLIFFFITKIVELRGVKTTTPYNFLFYYFAFMSVNSLLNNPIRCQMFSFLFFTVFLYILELSRNGKDKPLYFMPLIMLVWCNLHGGCVSGLGLIFLYIIGEFLNKRSVKKYIYSLLGCLLVLPINPWGFEYLNFLFMANTLHRADVAEWMGLFSKLFLLRYMNFKIIALLLLLSEFLFIVKQSYDKKLVIDKTKFIVIFATLGLGIAHVKLVPLALISLICFLYDDFYTVFNFLTKDIFNKIAKIKDFVVYLIILFFVIFNLSYEKLNQPLIDASRYPIRTIEFVKINQIRGNLLIAFGQGSYASYKLYPQNKIFTDGRYEEVYYPDLMPLLKNFYTVKENWHEILDKYPPDVMIIEKFYPIYDVLKNEKDWVEIFNDNFFGVFVPFSNVKSSYKIPTLDINHYRKTLFDTNIDFKSNK